MTLYLANPSRQPHVFFYREPVNQLLQHVRIADGTQVAIGEKWSADQCAAVIAQVQRYGGRDAAEAHGKMTKFTGLLYRENGVISESEIRMANEAEEATREERAGAEMVKAALGFDRAMRPETKERPGTQETEVTVMQEVPRGQRRRGTETNLNLTVTPDGRKDVRLPVN